MIGLAFPTVPRVVSVTVTTELPLVAAVIFVLVKLIASATLVANAAVVAAPLAPITPAELARAALVHTISTMLPSPSVSLMKDKLSIKGPVPEIVIVAVAAALPTAALFSPTKIPTADSTAAAEVIGPAKAF